MDEGWIALAFHFGALFMHIFVFGTWAKFAVKKAPDDPRDGQPADEEAGARETEPAPPVAARPDEIDNAIAEMKQSDETNSNPLGDDENETEET